MKFPPNHIVPGAAGFLAMAVLGWILAGESSERDSGKSTDGPHATRSSRQRPSRPTSPSNLAHARLATIRNAADPAGRLRATIALANALPVSEFGKWLGGGWFSLRNGAEFTLFSNILRERWWREDPEGFFLWSIKNESRRVPATLASWAASQPQQFLDFFKRHPDNSAQLAALADLAKTHPDLALQCLLEMKGDRLFNSDLFETLAEKSPAALEAALDSFKGSMRTQVERLLLFVNFKNDYAGEFRKLWSRPDGFEIYEEIASQVDGMHAAILDDLTALPPEWLKRIVAHAGGYSDAESAEKWWNIDLIAVGFSKSEANHLQTRALREIAHKNPELALQRLAGLEIRRPESEQEISDDRWETIANALAAWPDKTADLIALLTTEEDRNAAASILESMEEKNDSDAADSVETPEQWLAKFTTIDPGSHSDYAWLLRSWNSEQLAMIGDQFQTLPDDQKQRVARAITGSVSAMESQPPLVGEALRYLLTHPAEAVPGTPTPLVGKTSNYIAKLAIDEPETARDWIQTLPDGEPKLWAQANLHSLWSGYDPKAADQWFKTLPPATQAEVRKITKK
ncbi:MAG: hypothetical protein V4689_06540 [Verrucomicrobiota bacterium]